MTTADLAMFNDHTRKMNAWDPSPLLEHLGRPDIPTLEARAIVFETRQQAAFQLFSLYSDVWIAEQQALHQAGYGSYYTPFRPDTLANSLNLEDATTLKVRLRGKIRDGQVQGLELKRRLEPESGLTVVTWYQKLPGDIRVGLRQRILDEEGEVQQITVNGVYSPHVTLSMIEYGHTAYRDILKSKIESVPVDGSFIN